MNPQRIVFLGDSITDGNTYPLLIHQTLAEAGKPVPICINAGIGGDTAKGMRARLDRDVLVHRPMLVTLQSGPNDASHKVEPADYEADMEAIAARMKAENVSLVLLTICPVSPKHAALQPRLDAYAEALRRIAKKYDLRVAEVNAEMTKARDAGQEILSPDGIHLEFAGYLPYTRAVLDALGYPDVAVPRELKTELLPGIVTPWQIRGTQKDEKMLDEKSIATLHVDETWKPFALPEPNPAKDWWPEQERRRGYAMTIADYVGKAPRYIGVATIESPRERKAFLNTGGNLQTIWLDGKQIYHNTEWTGFHAGKERVPVTLIAGKNQIVIETGGSFFLSVTETNDW